MVSIDCISDLHGHTPKLPGGDILILCGDYTSADKVPEWVAFFRWLHQQKYRNKILIAGNHDGFFFNGFPKDKNEADNLAEVQSFLTEQGELEPTDFTYLCDSGTTVDTDKGPINIWGSPWTPIFEGVNPKCKYFMQGEYFLNHRFEMITTDVDILVTHGPMMHLLDTSWDYRSCGSHSLRKHIDRVKPRFHVFGHIHEQGGNQLMYKHQGPQTWCVNCSYVDEHYNAKHGPIRLKW